jgi:PBSX family phage terminase large subunit
MTSQKNNTTIKTSELIAPVFFTLWNDVKNCKFSELDVIGGRYSTKSSFVSLVIVLSMMRDRTNGELTHAVALRKTGKDLRESVFEQIGWAIDKLGVSHLWKRSLSPMKWVYMPSSKKPQEIRFRGCDDPSKVKSIKFAYGYPKY